jgi:hypothetical protein
LKSYSVASWNILKYDQEIICRGFLATEQHEKAMPNYLRILMHSMIMSSYMKCFIYLCPQMMQESVSLFMFVLQMKEHEEAQEAAGRNRS